MKMTPTEFYASPGRQTDVTHFGIDVAGVEEAVDIVQGLVVYDPAAKDLYGVELPPVQAGAVHERDAAALLELARTIDPRPLDRPRRPGARIGGRCHTFTLLTVDNAGPNARIKGAHIARPADLASRVYAYPAIRASDSAR